MKNDNNRKTAAIWHRPLGYLSLLLLGSAVTSVPVKAQTAETDTVALEPRTYMGEKVMASESQYDTKDSFWSKVRASGSIQTEFHVPVHDALTEDQGYADKKLLNNTYFDLAITAPYVSLGGRFEFAKWPLPAFYDTPGYAGWGVPYFWANVKYGMFQVTGGDFYEQFGSGLILRSYNERNMGIDNAIRGGRLKLNPTSGIYLTGLVGKERYYWEHNPALVWGADAEWALDETFSKAFAAPYGVSLGFSYVGKHQGQTEFLVPPTYDSKLYFPETVGAFDYRAKLRMHDFSLLAEGAYKSEDPCAFNNFTYGKGHAELLSLSYAKKGIAAFIQAKRSQNMRFVSDRMQNDLQGNGNINHLPAFTMTQTYTLAALYAYSTQSDGEWAFQAELGYLFPRGTALGGKYGTNVRMSASFISGLDDMPSLMYQTMPPGSNGYNPSYWKIGTLYYSDFNFEIKKKVTKNLQFTLFYLFQKFDLNVIQGHGSMMTANTFVLEGQWKMAKKAQLRWELQYLTTKKDEGDWMCGLVEVSFAPHWMITLSDTYNNGNPGKKENYYKAMVTYNYKANRFSLSYGRTRAGYDCAGGVCRMVPATNGLSLTYNYTF